MFNLDKNYIYLYYLFDSNIFQNKNNKKADRANSLLIHNIKKLLSQQTFPLGMGGGEGEVEHMSANPTRILFKDCCRFKDIYVCIRLGYISSNIFRLSFISSITFRPVTFSRSYTTTK